MDMPVRAAEVLFVLNELEEPDYWDLEFCVITGGYTETPGTGAAAGEMVRLSWEHFWPFEKAEIIVVSKKTGGEPFGQGRKPSKWGVSARCFGSVAEAMECWARVLAGTWEGGNES